MFYGEEEVKTAMGAGEGHEVSDKVCVGQASVTDSESGESYFLATGRLIDGQGRGSFLSCLRMLDFPEFVP